MATSLDKNTVSNSSALDSYGYANHHKLTIIFKIGAHALGAEHMSIPIALSSSLSTAWSLCLEIEKVHTFGMQTASESFTTFIVMGEFLILAIDLQLRYFRIF